MTCALVRQSARCPRPHRPEPRPRHASRVTPGSGTSARGQAVRRRSETAAPRGLQCGGSGVTGGASGRRNPPRPRGRGPGLGAPIPGPRRVCAPPSGRTQRGSPCLSPRAPRVPQPRGAPRTRPHPPGSLCRLDGSACVAVSLKTGGRMSGTNELIFGRGRRQVTRGNSFRSGGGGWEAHCHVQPGLRFSVTWVFGGRDCPLWLGRAGLASPGPQTPGTAASRPRASGRGTRTGSPAASRRHLYDRTEQQVERTPRKDLRPRGVGAPPAGTRARPPAVAGPSPSCWGRGPRCPALQGGAPSPSPSTQVPAEAASLFGRRGRLSSTEGTAKTRGTGEPRKDGEMLWEGRR